MKSQLKFTQIASALAIALALTMMATAQDTAKMPAHGNIKTLFNGKY